MQEYGTDSLLNLLSSLGLLGLEPSPWCSTPETATSTTTIRSVPKENARSDRKTETDAAVQQRRPAQIPGQQMTCISAGDKRPAQVGNPLADLWKDSHGLPTNKLLGSTDVEGEAHPSFSKEFLSSFNLFMSRKHHFVRTRAIKTWVWVFLALWCCGFTVKASFLGLFNESFESCGFCQGN